MRENCKFISEVVRKENGKLKKRHVKFDVSNLTFNEKKELIKNKLIEIYGEMPSGVSFVKMVTKKPDHNPDGYRILVHCNWIERNRFYDGKGIFKFGAVVKAINKNLEGTTNINILRKDLRD